MFGASEHCMKGLCNQNANMHASGASVMAVSKAGFAPVDLLKRCDIDRLDEGESCSLFHLLSVKISTNLAELLSSVD